MEPVSNATVYIVDDDAGVRKRWPGCCVRAACPANRLTVPRPLRPCCRPAAPAPALLPAAGRAHARHEHWPCLICWWRGAACTPCRHLPHRPCRCAHGGRRRQTRRFDFAKTVFRQCLGGSHRAGPWPNRRERLAELRERSSLQERLRRADRPRTRRDEYGGGRRPNKLIADQLDISVRTVEVHPLTRVRQDARQVGCRAGQPAAPAIERWIERWTERWFKTTLNCA